MMFFNQLIEFGLCKKFEGSFIINCFSIKLLDKKNIDNYSVANFNEANILGIYEKDHEILIEEIWTKKLVRTFKCMKVKDPSHKFEIVLDLSKPLSNWSLF
jgi:hypothetical protein